MVIPTSVVPVWLAAAALAATVDASDATSPGTAGEPAAAGAVGGPGLALVARKVLTAADGRGFLDNAVVLVREGRIEAVEPRRGFEFPAGYVVVDLGERWLAPGLVELHCHVAAGLRDLSETTYLTNPGMRISVAVRPGNELLREGVAGGVTTVLHIPGSATNMGGQGVLMRSAFEHYEDALLRDPGSLKLAQAGNPERRAPWYPGRSFMNYNTRSTFRRGLAYAKRTEEMEAGGPPVERDLQFDVFRELAVGRTQVSTHTQIYQVVLMTMTFADDFGVPFFIDHGTFDGWLAAPVAERLGVPAILGPRQITNGIRAPGFAEYDQDGAIFGCAAKYQELGHTKVGFNTDCVGSRGRSVSQEELSLQAAMGVRYGFDDSDMQALRGITSVPAETIDFDHRLGSIEPGKDADLICTSGDPVDPRSSVEIVWSRGIKVYDTAVDRRRF